MDKLSEIKVLSLSERVTSTGVVTNGVTLRVAEGIKVRGEGERQDEKRENKRQSSILFFFSLPF